MELLLKLVPAITSVCFSIGGTGYKWIRRWILPYTMTLLHKNVWVFILTVIAMHLPYGDSLKEHPWIRYIVFGAFFLPFLILGWTWWILVSWLITSILFIVSNSNWGEKIVPHWIWEPIVGFLMGICLTGALNG